MTAVVCVDFGSTFTKAALVDLDTGDLLATAWCDDDDGRLDACRARVLAAVTLVDHAVPPPPMTRVLEILR